jgi:hypothetical protein
MRLPLFFVSRHNRTNVVHSGQECYGGGVIYRLGPSLYEQSREVLSEWCDDTATFERAHQLIGNGKKEQQRTAAARLRSRSSSTPITSAAVAANGIFPVEVLRTPSS